MSNYRKVNNDSSDSELDSGDDERVLPSASVQNATDEPATKRSRCVWTDVALEQSLEMHRTLVTDGKECNIDRGSESYSAIKTQYRDDFVRDFDDNGNKKSKKSRTSSFRGRGRGGLGIARGRGGGVNVQKRRFSEPKKPFLPEGYSLEKLAAAEFEEGLTTAELAEEASEALGEKKLELMAEIIQEIGQEKFLELFEKTRSTELNGGMMTNNKDRRKTPGGVFMHFVRGDPGVSQEFKDKIFINNRRELKVAKRNRKKAAEGNDKDQPKLRTAAEVFLGSAAASLEEGEVMDED